MNPVPVNSTNIINFGFKATFDILNRQIRFDITGLTTFNGGGAVAVKGVSFEVEDPFGVKIHSFNFAAPDIDPNVISTFNLPIAAGDGIFGIWKIKGGIQEANDAIFYAEIPPKEICKPTGLEDDKITGAIELEARCSAGNIKLSETTLLVYKSLEPLTVTKTGTLYPPRGTGSDVSYTTTPRIFAPLYTGRYEARQRTLATYDLGDNLFVELAYDSTAEQKVTCKDRICDIACCIKETKDEYENNKTNARGLALKVKLDAIVIPLVTAAGLQECGKDASAEIQQIRDILGCSCDCENKIIEATPVSVGEGLDISFEGACAAAGGIDYDADEQKVTIKVKYTVLAKKDVGDLAFDISVSEDTCNKTYTIAFNYAILANTILNTIKNSTDLLDLLNSMIYASGNILAGLDGKCIINTLVGNYSWSKLIPSTTNLINIVIDSIVYVAPGGLLASNQAGISAWLNGLGKGTFVVVSTPSGGNSTLTISTTANTHIVNALTYAATAMGAKTQIPFTAVNVTLLQFLQALVDHICGIGTDDIKLGVSIDMCQLNDEGEVEVVTYDADVLLSTYLEDQAEQQCRIMNLATTGATLNCAAVQAVFPFRDDVSLGAFDGVYVVKNGQCSKVTVREMANVMLTLIKTDPVLLASFCAIDCGAELGDCPHITGVTSIAEEDAQEIRIDAVSFAVTPGANQYLTVRHRLYGTSEWTVDTTNLMVTPAGFPAAPFVIEDLVQGAQYEYQVFVTAFGSCIDTGFTGVVTIPVESETNIVSFVNRFNETGVITSLKFGAGANILPGNINGDNFYTYDYSALGAGPFVIKMTLTGKANPTEIHWAQMRGAAVINSGYFNYTTGEVTIIAALTPVTGDVIIFRDAAEHLKIANYSANEGTIGGVCSLPLFTISRNALATADANNAGDSVDVTVQWDASNTGTSTDTVTFAPADTNKTGSHGNIGSGGCDYVNGTILTAELP